jgi:hypothetical protein
MALSRHADYMGECLLSEEKRTRRSSRFLVRRQKYCPPQHSIMDVLRLSTQIGHAAGLHAYDP